ncbi:MAG: ABC transporter permease [Ectothiorhodospiraceae bacterium]|nr:ABC transporter permease [Chromatiales bacterium]MCP5157650.1 ABC transporter permease [Ectothiorhodospiraceae bacterium]
MTAAVTPVGTNAEALAADSRRERRRAFFLTSPAALLIAVVVFVPVGWLFWLSLFDPEGALTAENYTRMLGSPAYVKTFKTTFEVSFVVTAVCVLIGYPLAYLLSQLPARAANVCMVFVLLPFWTSLLVRTYAWLVLLQRKGLINTWLIDLGVIEQPLRLVHNFTGTVIGMVHILLPFLVLPLYAAMRSIDRDLIRAAANLGSSPVGAFWRVFFPLSLPGLFAGVVLVFVLCLGFYVTPALLGGGRVQMWAMRIESSVNLYANWGAASALGVVLLIVTLVLLWALNKLFGLERVFSGR